MLLLVIGFGAFAWNKQHPRKQNPSGSVDINQQPPVLLPSPTPDPVKPDTSPMQLESLKQKMNEPETLKLFPNQKLYVIDNQFIFWQRGGRASDYSYEHLLLDDQQNRLCSYSDSIVGPRITCNDSTRTEFFSTIIANLDKEDLGLGLDHKVVLVYSLGK